MASGTVVGDGTGGNEGSRDKQKWAESKVYTRKSFKGLKSGKNNNPAQAQTLPSQDANSSHQPVFHRLDVVSDDSSSLNRQQVDPMSTRSENLGFLRQESRTKINFSTKRSKQERRELRRKLENELDMIRNLVRKIEEKQGNMIVGDGESGRVLRRVHSEVGSVGTPREGRPLHQLSISILENSQGLSDNVEKEKRTPKANQFYRNSEFILGKDKFPLVESNKKSKSNSKKGGGNDSVHGFGLGKFSNQVFKSCSNLLERLMKHKHGWVFNEPVDPLALGLHDYLDIIKHPMDLGTVKSRLTKNWYKSPREFAEDVRLTFMNARTYNPKGQDVHVMAETLSNIFEEKWAVIEADYMRELRLAVDFEVGLPSPTSRKAPQLPPPPRERRRNLDRSESMTHPAELKSRISNFGHSGRTPVPKKPKAKDPSKRDMTYDEKQKLSTNLQNLPAEKLDNIVQIIRKRNSSLCQRDDEIEVDIDSVDNETLWELDRFVTNYKKNLSKNKRKVELANQAKGEGVQNLQGKDPSPTVLEAQKETKTDEKNNSTSSQPQAEKLGDNAGGSSRASSSSSESGSSTDSDSDSSSGDESDAGRSPRS